jgi:hypothetical protein
MEIGEKTQRFLPNVGSIGVSEKNGVFNLMESSICASMDTCVFLETEIRS